MATATEEMEDVDTDNMNAQAGTPDIICIEVLSSTSPDFQWWEDDDDATRTSLVKRLLKKLNISPRAMELCTESPSEIPCRQELGRQCSLVRFEPAEHEEAMGLLAGLTAAAQEYLDAPEEAPIRATRVGVEDVGMVWTTIDAGIKVSLVLYDPQDAEEMDGDLQEQATADAEKQAREMKQEEGIAQRAIHDVNKARQYKEGKYIMIILRNLGQQVPRRSETAALRAYLRNAQQGFITFFNNIGMPAEERDPPKVHAKDDTLPNTIDVAYLSLAVEMGRKGKGHASIPYTNGRENPKAAERKGAWVGVPLHRQGARKATVQQMCLNSGKRPGAQMMGFHECTDALRERSFHGKDERCPKDMESAIVRKLNAAERGIFDTYKELEIADYDEHNYCPVGIRWTMRRYKTRGGARYERCRANGGCQRTLGSCTYDGDQLEVPEPVLDGLAAYAAEEREEQGTDAKEREEAQRDEDAREEEDVFVAGGGATRGWKATPEAKRKERGVCVGCGKSLAKEPKGSVKCRTCTRQDEETAAAAGNEEAAGGGAAQPGARRAVAVDAAAAEEDGEESEEEGEPESKSPKRVAQPEWRGRR